MVAPAVDLSRSLRSLPLASLGDSPTVRRDIAPRSRWDGAAACRPTPAPPQTDQAINPPRLKSPPNEQESPKTGPLVSQSGPVLVHTRGGVLLIGTLHRFL